MARGLIQNAVSHTFDPASTLAGKADIHQRAVFPSNVQLALA
jgi:hypothetical protein